jgi:type IV pilus assembly protein PilB
MLPIDLRAFIVEVAKASEMPFERFHDLIKEVNGDPFVLAESIVKRRWLERERVGMLLGNVIGKTYLDLSTTLFQRDAVELLPKEFAERHRAIPVYRFGNAVTVAMARPLDPDSVKALKAVIPCPVDTVMSFADEIDTAIKLHYEIKDEIDVEALDGELTAISKMSEEALAKYKPVVELADKLLMLAIKEGTSDIHVEPKETFCAVRFRKDGVLRERIVLNATLATALTSRFKVMGRMDIAEKRKPQDGRIKFRTPVKDIDIRVSSLPVLFGEKIVMRLLGSLGKEIPLNIERLGLSPHVLTGLKKVLDEPNGIVFVTGPTGSGKTTTLYGALNYLDRPDDNITTIEDPVEYVMPSFNQCHVDERAGRSFSEILRSILRQDPDVVLVGEIRDGETAAIATQAALTGHLVLSSLHTNSALQAMTRLTDMGVAPHILAPAVKGIVAQRLIRRLCEYCKQAVTPLTEEYLSRYLEADVSNFQELPPIYEANGCKHCNGSGYAGRLGIHEILVVDQEVQDLILGNRPLADLRRHAYEHGFVDMKADGFVKVLQGLTTFDEVLRATSQI